MIVRRHGDHAGLVAQRRFHYEGAWGLVPRTDYEGILATALQVETDLRLIDEWFRHGTLVIESHLRVKRPLVWGLLYIFIWEGFIARGSSSSAVWKKTVGFAQSTVVWIAIAARTRNSLGEVLWRERCNQTPAHASAWL